MAFNFYKDQGITSIASQGSWAKKITWQPKNRGGCRWHQKGWGGDKNTKVIRREKMPKPGRVGPSASVAASQCEYVSCLCLSLSAKRGWTMWSLTWRLWYLLCKTDDEVACIKKSSFYSLWFADDPSEQWGLWQQFALCRLCTVAVAVSSLVCVFTGQYLVENH